MKTRYDIQVIHDDRADRVSELRDAVETELMDVGLHHTIEVTVDEVVPSGDAPAVAVYLGDEAAARAVAVQAACERAIAVGMPVIPVVDDLAEFRRDVPSALLPLNGIGWEAHAVACVLLAELGIEERQRRVFISHKRDDGLGAAEQLHDALTHSRFLPFIDRFVIPHGARVQDTIADALEDHAFLLLLETPLAWQSDWVFDEVEYALSHTMGILIVRWPGDVRPVPGSKGLGRLELEPTDLVTDDHGYEVLTDDALERVSAEVERAHAHGLVRRRRMLVLSVEEAARAGGATSCVPLPHWRLLVKHSGTSTIVGVSPRLPTAQDLQHLDAARSETEAGACALLVHSARILRPDRTQLLEWVVGDRDLELMPENAIGGRWR